MDASEEVSGCLIVASRNRSVLLEPTIEVLHEVARLVHFLVVEALNLSITPGRNDELFSCRKQRLDDARIGIESLVCQQGVGQHLGQKRVGTFQIMSLPRSQEESQRIAKGIDHGMDFRAQSAFAAPDRLVFAVFF
jgi:hypothetical protein